MNDHSSFCPTPVLNASALQPSMPGTVDVSHEDTRIHDFSFPLLKSESEVRPGYAKHGWRPRYLQQRVLLPSGLLCVSLIVAVELLFWFSERNRGLGNSRESLHYLWTYGPTAVLTAIGAIWTRVDHQAKLIAPWNQLASGPAAAKQTMLLDYISPLPPVSIFGAIRNRDFGVAAAGLVALLWSLIIAISASLINLTPTDNHPTNVIVRVTTAFMDDSTGLYNSRSLSYCNMLGLQEANLSFPDGVSDRYAYQKFNGRDIPDNAELHTTIDGFSATLICEESTYHVARASFLDTGHPLLNFTMASTGCKITSGWAGPVLTTGIDLYYSRFGAVSCQNSSHPDDQRIAVMFGSLKYGALAVDVPFPGSPVDIHDTQGTSLLCRPTYTISKIEAVKNGTDIIDIMPSLSEPETLGNVHAWDVTEALMRSFENPISRLRFTDQQSLFPQPFNASDAVISVDPPMDLALNQLSAPPPLVALRNASFLEDVIINYYRTHTLFVANDLLLQPVSLELTGQAIIYQERLIVNGTTAHAMAGILAAATVLFGIVIITMPKTSIVACAPSSIAGVAKLASGSNTTIQQFKDLGRSDADILVNRLGNCHYMTSVQDGDAFNQGYFEITATESIVINDNTQLKNPPLLNPLLLRLWSRATVSFLILGIIAALEIILRISLQNHGIGDAPIGSSYLHYSWTTIPALIFTIIGLTYGSMDFNVRKLTPYINLSHGSTYERTLGLNMLDLSVPRALIRETRTKNFSALCSTSAALIASLLATFSSSLFVLSDVPEYSTVALSVENTFETAEYVAQSELSLLTSTLILDSNLSYPEFTHENLVFPSLSLSSNNTSDDGLSVDTIIPALRPRMDCRLLNSSSLTVSPLDTYTTITPLEITIIDDPGCPPPSVLRFSLGTSSVGFNRTGVIAGTVRAACADEDKFNHWNYPWVYAWAEITLVPDLKVNFISTLLCNESVEVVNASVLFIGTDLSIDRNSPPVPDEGTVANSPQVIAGSVSDYVNLPNGPNGDLDEFFYTLTTSRYAIPPDYLADPSKSQIVQEAIIWQHSIIRAQALNYDSRVTSGTRNSSNAARSEENAVTYQGNSTGAVSRVRVVQDTASTRILQSLLAAILVLSLVSWALMPETKVLPREPTSIASVLALLADGNIFEILPTTSQTMKDSAINRLMSGVTFKMGLVESMAEGEQTRASHNHSVFAIYYWFS